MNRALLWAADAILERLLEHVQVLNGQFIDGQFDGQLGWDKTAADILYDELAEAQAEANLEDGEGE
jgi:hypothetical protein